jgi:plasmid maintenance system antidote protein VapI
MGGGEHPSDLELVAWADGDLAGVESSVIGAHLEMCPACRGLVAGLQPRLSPSASRPAAPKTEVLPGSLMEVLAAGCVADPGAGQLWQLEWDGRGAVGLIVGVDADTVRVVPAEDDPHLGDDWALLLEEAASPIGLGFVLWTGLAVSVPMRVLNVLLGVVPEPVMTGVQDAFAARAANQAGAADGIGAPISSVLDERAQLVEGIKRRFAELAAASWLLAAAGEPARIGELLRAAGLQATQVADHLGLPPREVLKLVRNQRPLSPEEAVRLAELLGVAPSTLGATLAIPTELVTALDRPSRRTQLRALAETAGTSEATFRRAEALAILPMAARRTGAPDAGPDWEQLVEDRLRGR